MKFAGLLEAGRLDGVLTESKWVKGTYIAVNSITERNKIHWGVLTAGTKCYVNVGDNNNPAGEYRWNGSSWDYVGPGITYADLEEDNWHIYGRRKTDGKNAQWVQIDSTYLSELITGKFKEKLDDLYAKRDALEAAVKDLESLTARVVITETGIETLEKTTGELSGKIIELDAKLEEVIGDNGPIERLKEELTERLNTLDEQLQDIQSKVDKVDEFDNRITSAENNSNSALSIANSASQAAAEAVQKAKDAFSAAENAQKAVNEVDSRVQRVESNVTEINNRLDTGNFTVPLATEEKVGGIKAANNSPSETRGELTRYYVGVQEDSDGGRAYVDIKPGEAIIDEESLKTALTKNENEVIKNTIWPTIESKIEEDDWVISGGTAEKL